MWIKCGYSFVRDIISERKEGLGKIREIWELWGLITANSTAWKTCSEFTAQTFLVKPANSN